MWGSPITVIVRRVPTVVAVGDRGDQVREPLSLRGFRRFWLASTAGFLGVAITGVAADVLVVNSLGASEFEVGMVKAAQFVPYLVVGLVAGVVVDRFRRRPTLVVAHAAQGLLLLLIPILWWMDTLNVWTLALVLMAAGTFGILSAAAEQSLIVDLVDRGSLVGANARLGQSITVSQSAGPPLGGLITGLAGVAGAFTVGALSRILAAIMISRVSVDEPATTRQADRQSLLVALSDGLRFIYRHRTLAPLAASTHIWFLANSVALTALALYALRDLELSGAQYGAVLAATGVGGLLGAVIAPRLGRGFGEGNVMIGSRALCAVAWLAAVTVPAEIGAAAATVWLSVAMLAYGVAMGAEDPNEMGYWQASTPHRLLGRVNASRRTVNRSVAVVGSLVGGVFVGWVGSRLALAGAIAVFIIAAGTLLLSPLRGARVAATATDAA